MNENLSQKFQKALASKKAIKDKLNEKGCNVGDIFEEYADAIDTLTKPQGTLDITENGDYDVTEYASANVNVTGPKPTTIPTIYDAILYVDTSELTSTENLFKDVGILTTTPLFDTSKVTNMQYMFYNCQDLTSVPLYNTSKVTNMQYMFYNCKYLTTVPLFDTSNVRNMSRMLGNCSKLTTVPLYNTSNVIDMSRMLAACTILTTVPLYNTSNVIDMSFMLYNCFQLTSVPAFDVRNATTMTSMLGNCSKLTSILMYGMKAAFDISASTLLEPEALVTILSNCQVITATRTLTMGSTLLAKLDGVYVKETGNELYEGITCRPCVICESTDEGAMLATDYITSKGWSVS